MSESQQDFETRLQQSYRAEKQTVKMPDAIRQNVLLKANRADKGHTFGNAGQKMGLAALAASLILSVLYLLLPTSEPRHQPFTLVEYHTLETQSANSYAKTFSYEQFEQELNNKNEMLNAQRKGAFLAIEEDGSWQLQTCEEQALHLSQELVVMLQSLDRLPKVTTPGTSMQILLAQDGHIIKGEPRSQPLVCD